MGHPDVEPCCSGWRSRMIKWGEVPCALSELKTRCTSDEASIDRLCPPKPCRVQNAQTGIFRSCQKPRTARYKNFELRARRLRKS